MKEGPNVIKLIAIGIFPLFVVGLVSFLFFGPAEKPHTHQDPPFIIEYLPPLVLPPPNLLPHAQTQIIDGRSVLLLIPSFMRVIRFRPINNGRKRERE